MSGGEKEGSSELEQWLPSPTDRIGLKN
jgi:hypothetical protein